MFLQKHSTIMSIMSKYYLTKLISGSCFKKSGPKSIYFDITKNTHRFLFCVFWYFYKEKYQIYLRKRAGILEELWKDRYCKNIFAIPSLIITKRNFKKVDMSLMDHQGLQGSGKTLRIKYDYYSEIGSDSYRFPFTPHPNRLTGEAVEKNLQKRENSNRLIRIFFTGNLHPASYSKRNMFAYCSEFMSRIEVINILKKNIDPQIIKFPQSRSESDFCLEKENPIVVCDSKLCDLSGDSYFSALSKASFFLALSGVHTPHSHNIVEAMAMGCIPILEYSQLLSPPLKEFYNAISFRGERSLLQKIKYILGLKNETIQNMRRNVLKYYDDHLTSKAVINTIEKKKNLQYIYVYSKG